MHLTSSSTSSSLPSPALSSITLSRHAPIGIAQYPSPCYHGMYTQMHHFAFTNECLFWRASLPHHPRHRHTSIKLPLLRHKIGATVTTVYCLSFVVRPRRYERQADYAAFNVCVGHLYASAFNIPMITTTIVAIVHLPPHCCHDISTDACRATAWPLAGCMSLTLAAALVSFVATCCCD